ncbi:MAG: ABC transporter permease [Sulfobacillus benefaciens]|uniref:ABC transporter permease n=1 Tax=Sulfobacillus benefaciens TaxID=453960 RepID=A0A2T2X809_9FIRM|nr:MAG: ABC transporter permease [Sulfobacillus benefaciens]
MVRAPVPERDVALSSNAERMRNAFRHPMIPVLVVIVVLLLFGRILSPGFLGMANIGNILATSTILALAGLGQTFVIMGGGEGIDLSVGALVSLGAILGGAFSNGVNAGLLPALGLLVLLGGFVGFLNGMGVQWIGVPPLVMTLGMASVVDGFALAYTNGQPTGGAPPVLLSIGTGHLFGDIRWLIPVGIVIAIIGYVVLNRSRFGHQLQLVGNNRQAARLSGLPLRNIIIASYVIAGIASILAGVLLLGYAGSSDLEIGNSYTLLSIAAVVIGGTKLTGGEGSYIGTVLGAIALIVLTNVLVAMRLPEGAREVLEGLALVAILVAYTRRRGGQRHLRDRRAIETKGKGEAQ